MWFFELSCIDGLEGGWYKDERVAKEIDTNHSGGIVRPRFDVQMALNSLTVA